MADQLKDTFDTLERSNEALRLAEEKYRSIYENALEGIFLIGLKLAIENFCL